MGQGAFNVIRWAQEMGLVSLRELPIRETATPTMSLGDFSNLTPRHEAPTGIAGGVAPNVVGELSMIELHSLGQGGAVVTAWNVLLPAAMQIEIAGGPVLAGAISPNQIASDDAPLSVVRVGSVVFAPPSPLGNVQATGMHNQEIFIPPGGVLRLLAQATNTLVSGIIFFRDVPSAEAPRS